MGVFLTVLSLLPSVIRAVQDVVKAAKKQGKRVERSKVKEGVCRGLEACAVKSKTFAA